MIKKLKDEIVSPKGLAGFTLHKIHETDKYYIYHKVNTEMGYDAGYELFERRENTMFKCETIPGGNAFGVWAWQLPTKQHAFDKLNYLINEQTKLSKTDTEV